MANNYKIKQIRYYGENIDNTASSDENNSAIGRSNIQSTQLEEGTAFEYPIKKLGIQTLPGIKFYLTENAVDPIVIGMSGIYELDLTNSMAEISKLRFNRDSLSIINRADGGYLIIDTMYDSST